MVTIQVAHEVSAAAFARVQALAEEAPLRDADFNGTTVRVERDDFTCVDDANGIRGTILLQQVYRAIDGE